MKKKISMVLLASVISSNISPVINVFADDILKEKTKIIEEKTVNQASVSKFSLASHENLEEYNSKYKIQREGILSISNNGGQYGSSSIDKAIDNDIYTHWETGEPNSENFTNEVTVEFKNMESINKIVYATRQDGASGKGYPTKFEIYASVTGNEEDFKLVSEASSATTGELMEFKFQSITAKKIKFVFVEANEDWASASEFCFYREDSLRDEVLDIFTDKTLSVLKEDYNSLEIIDKLQNQVNNHPLKEDLQTYLDIAKDILNNKLQTIKTVVAEQNGDMKKHAQNNLGFGLGSNLQSTGVYALPGETIIIYVDAEENKPLPKISFSQQEGSWSSWINTVELKAGKNVITVPEISQDQNYEYEVVSGGPIYIVNPYTEEEQGKAPVIRFASGCETFPYFDGNTKEEDFIEFLKEYKVKLDDDINANPNLEDRKVLDVFEFVSDHVFFTGTASAAYNVYVKNKAATPSETISSWNTSMNEIFKFYGLDGSDINNDPMYIRENIRIAQPWGYMYASGDHTGVQSDVLEDFLIPFEVRKSSNWGISHEIGHRMDMDKRIYDETTNNMLAIYMDYYYGVGEGSRIPYDLVYENIISENSNEYVGGDYFEMIAPFWQLEVYHPGYWGELNSLYRERDKEINILSGDKYEESKTEYLVRFSSEIVGLDLGEYFARHGFPVSDEVREEMASKYNKQDSKLWYINDTMVSYQGEGFSENTNTSLSTSKQNNNIKLDFSVSEDNKDDLLGYEILRDGEVIAFTTNSSYVDKNANLDKNQVYSVVAFDKKLNTAKKVEANSYSPVISLSQEKVTLSLNEEFKVNEYVKATNYKGDKLDNLTISSDVDTSKKGTYTVKYTVNDNGIEVSKTMEVQVVSRYDYLSDKAWSSVTTDWGTPRRNNNIKGRVNGEITTFEKGFGIHANGSIVYDLGEHNYENFEALLGVDMNVDAQSESSITFKVTADGETLATTNILKYQDDMVYINVPVKGVKELKIEVYDGGNDNAYDHAIIVNPKLIVNNSKPTLEVGDREIIKIREDYDLMKNITAYDAEDGNITNKIQINKNNFTTEKAGTYKVEYTVTDSDNNTVTKTKEIVVYSSTSYASDNEYTIQKSGWGGIRNDKSPANDTISLLINGQEKEFTKGIGAHANSEITYDISDKNYEYFHAYLGVDNYERNNANASVKFKVLVDGEVVYTSDIIRASTEAEEILIPVKNAKEIKLVTDQGNEHDWADQSVWADAKFLIANSLPELTIPSSVAIKVGEELSLDEEYRAIDAEDGDLTSKVIIEGNVDFNKAGKYEITYSVTDSDKNTTKLSRYVNVVDMNKYTYLSDIDWKSTSNSYTSPLKNQSISNNKIRLTDENGNSVAYDKGIGAHSTSSIVYDLTNSDYGYFTSYIGIDREMYYSIGSVNFQVYLDNEKVYDSGLMKSQDIQKFVEINLSGAKELKLVVTDGGNGDGSDHGNWADAKFH